MTKEFASPKFVVSGRGVVSAIGSNWTTFSASLNQDKTGIAYHTDLIPGHATHAGLAHAYRLPQDAGKIGRSGMDKNAEMAIAAVYQALTEANLLNEHGKLKNGTRTAVLLGTSHGGRAQLDWLVESATDPCSREAAAALLDRAAHHYQTALVAAQFGVSGPVQTFSTACSSSGTALMHGMEMLRQHKADAVVIVGADAFSKMTWAGFSALGAVADQPCGPFGETIGMNLGEGAAAVVLERESDRISRHAPKFGEILACATSWDAYHLTAPEPGGNGIQRAIEDSLACAAIQANQIDYVNAHGTGTRANDGAESNGILAAFRSHGTEPVLPPVSGSKSFTGHTLGASSVMGLLASLVATDLQILPATLHHHASRQGCTLDYVPGHARAAKVDYFLAQSAAFGGSNCVITGSGAHTQAPDASDYVADEIVLTGMGVVSALGCDVNSFSVALDSGLKSFEHHAAGVSYARVQGFEARKQLPRGTSARLDSISQYAIGAIQQALVQAGLDNPRQRPPKIGLMVALCRGAVMSFENYIASVHGAQWEKASAISFPNLVMSSVGGKAAIALGLKGPSSTMIGSSEVGLALLANAADFLRYREDVDAVVVVAADELSMLYLNLEAARSASEGNIPAADGAAALVLERAGKAQARAAKALASIVATDSGFSPELAAYTPRSPSEKNRSIAEQVVAAALMTCADGRYPLPASAIFAVTDKSEKLAGVSDLPTLHIQEKTGNAEACLGLFAVIAAVTHAHAGDHDRQGKSSVLLLGSGEMGSHTAVVLGFDPLGKSS
jgi:3-oxoacyl-[acyl-carrier-protein] synthase II